MNRGRISVGGENFAELRASGSYYVDKTDLIYELLQHNNNKVTLFTRPRRFGKTLNLRMLECFLDIRRESKPLFDGLAVAAYGTFCRTWMNQYPVLYLSLKDVEGLDFPTAQAMLAKTLSELCAEHAEVLDGAAVSDHDKEAFLALLAEQAGESGVRNGLKLLTRLLRVHYGKPAVLLIDEYDVPLVRASRNGFYAKMLDTIRGMFQAALKSNDNLCFAVLAGCLRVAQDRVFGGTGNFACYTVLDREFSEYFGFSYGEMEKLLRDTGLTGQAEMMRSWYGGYVFGDSTLYCPWEVLRRAAALQRDTRALPEQDWSSPGGSGLIRTFLDHREFSVNRKFETLLGGGAIQERVSNELTFDKLRATEQNLWSTLLMTGYLTKTDPKETGNPVTLRIPNREIIQVYRETVWEWFRDTLDGSIQKELFRALWSGDEAGAAALLSRLLRRMIRCWEDTEDDCQTFLSGIFSGAGYTVETNRNRGFGRPGIVVYDEEAMLAMVIEAQVAPDRASLDRSCQSALRKLLDMQYDQDFIEDYKILCYGVAFYRKAALVRRLDTGF